MSADAGRHRIITSDSKVGMKMLSKAPLNEVDLLSRSDDCVRSSIMVTDFAMETNFIMRKKEKQRNGAEIAQTSVEARRIKYETAIFPQ